MSERRTVPTLPRMDSATGEGSASGNREGAATLAAFGVVAGLVLLVPSLLGLAAFFALRTRLGRKEHIALLGVSGVLSIVAGGLVFGGYFSFLGGLLSGELSFSTIPWFGLVVLSALVESILGTFSGTRVLGRFGRAIRVRGTVITRGQRHSNEGSSIGGGNYETGDGGDSGLLPSLADRRQAQADAKIVGIPSVPEVESSRVPGSSVEPGKRPIPIGRALDQTPVCLTEDEIRMHGLVLGSTGSGKSETIKTLAGSLLDLGWSGTIVDLKEDTAAGGLREWCEKYSQYHATPYQELCLSNPKSATWFNTLSGMGPDEMRDTVLALNEFEAAYYEALNKELLGQIVMLMTWAHEIDPVQFPTPTMYDIAKLCGASSLPNATKKMRAVVMSAMPNVTDKDFHVLSAPSKAQQDSATGFGSRLGNLYDSQAGRIVLRPDGVKQEMDVTRDGLTYVGLDSQGKPDLTRVISSALLQRMSVFAAARTTGRAPKSNPRFLIVDEANWVNRQIAQNLLSRARGAGISMWLCTQGPQDWIDSDGDDWAKLTQNINVALVMRQGNAEAAEMCSELIGKSMQEKISEKVQQSRGVLLGPKRSRDQNGRLMESFQVNKEWDYIVAPDNIRNLTIGEALVRVGTPQQRLEYAKISMRDPTASPVRRLRD